MRLLRAATVIVTVIFVFLFPAYLFKSNWVLLISWIPALYVGAYLDNEINE